MEASGLRHFLKNKYLIVLALLGVLAILLPSYADDHDFWASYMTVGFIALVTFGLYENVRFQKLHRVLRPFIVTRGLQVVTGIASLFLFARTLALALESGAYTPYGVFWLLILLVNYQFYSIFHVAKRAKRDFPDRCEFC